VGVRFHCLYSASWLQFFITRWLKSVAVSALVYFADGVDATLGLRFDKDHPVQKAASATR
jgi:hypothetical protein